MIRDDREGVDGVDGVDGVGGVDGPGMGEETELDEAV
jgi:hypothetical protein